MISTNREKGRFRVKVFTPVLSILYSIIEFMRNFRIFKQVHRKRNYRDRSHCIYLDINEYCEPNHITIHRINSNIFIPNIHQTNSNSDKIDHKIKGTGDDVLDIFSVQEWRRYFGKQSIISIHYQTLKLLLVSCYRPNIISWEPIWLNYQKVTFDISLLYIHST